MIPTPFRKEEHSEQKFLKENAKDKMRKKQRKNINTLI